MIRGKYNLELPEFETVLTIVQNTLDALANDQRAIVDLTSHDIAPCHIREALRFLGWEDDDYDRNGWEGDTWYYFDKEDSDYRIIMFYCGYTFSIEMYRSDIDD